MFSGLGIRVIRDMDLANMCTVVQFCIFEFNKQCFNGKLHVDGKQNYWFPNSLLSGMSI